MADSRSASKLHETKLRIPFPSAEDPQLHIVGILAQWDPFGPHLTASPSASSSASSSTSTSTSTCSNAQPRPRTPLALITHGVLAHKDQAYHRPLRDALPLDSFRFDFRANHETPGEWNMSRFGDDVDDVEAVLEYLLRGYGYELALLVGHSRGSLGGWKWFAEKARGRRGGGEDGRLPLWVSLGGRWDMSRIHDRDELYREQFEKQGFYIWKAKVAGEKREVKITPDQVEEFAQYPIQDLVSRFPAECDCLLIHGTADETVPCPDVGYYLNALTSRTDRAPGQTQVHLVEGSNHMFKGHHDEVVSVIVRWYASRRGQTSSHATTASDAHDTGSAVGTKDSSDLALEASQTGDVLERSWREKTGAVSATAEASPASGTAKGKL